ncbi:uncharacterized protein LOC115769669 [Drosophila novamexicana]|uniref:uncharacterized protein LOC115769669 n=1 Tax=Drosophila novamexicana TaxID=47314 RepID=UPI0011E5FCC6|nr:uncharacterized protein LOC115769669 [Drosophila novamexicana]XP_030570444.1 uncharacterized protein LOC115769669 [Drosophila novamexicana]
MPQGKFKKAKLPAAIQNKKKQQKQAAFTRRANAPIQAKKGKFNETQKIKAVISKSVNKSVESELRSRAHEGYIQLSKAQEAVAKHHSTQAAAAAAAATAASMDKARE